MLLKFKSKVFLAPMAGITDIAFRELCIEYGASLTTTELISCKAIIQKNKKTLEMLERGKIEKPFTIQLFGDDPKDFEDAAKIVEDRCDIIDINMGCPAPKVCKIGAGSRLLSNPKKCGEIVKRVVDAIKLPVTVKIRLGIDEDNFTAIEVAKECERNGASMITIHGRYAKQLYSGKADWEKIKQIKKEIKIPVVGNGDITNAKDAEKKLLESGVDYIAIGRAASGNPFIFKQINEFLKTGKYSETTIQDRTKAFTRYLELAKDCSIPFLHQKLQAQHFVKGLCGAPKAREKISTAKTQEQLKEIVEEIFIK